MRLEGKVAIVVGGGQLPGESIGNGRATAILFAREGARVLVVDRDRASADETRQMILSEGGTAEALVADVTDEAAVARIPTACIEAFGRIDVLQNNVGIGGEPTPFHRLEREAWDTVMAVNLTGMFLTCKHVTPVMREQRQGAIVNISSVAAVVAGGGAPYKASKAAVNALTKHLALSNARYGVRANAIMPGMIDTPMAIDRNARARGVLRETVVAEREAMVPLLHHMGTAWDVAYASLFLASDDARFITGAILPVDGGHSLER